ncbi:MAG: hypothetical protein PHG06_09465 [Parabacteroides sp.]|nr:hypothetical protein [Parabacteroides sp.]
MASDNSMMSRGVHQALYRYLPGSWVDFTQNGVSYAVRVDSWNSVQLTNINNKRLLRVANQRVMDFRNASPAGPMAVVGFPNVINEENCAVLTPKVSEQIGAIRTSVNPLLFVCDGCGKVKQYYDYSEFRRNEHKRCECGSHFKQLRMISFCECGYAVGLSPFCATKEHGRKYIVRRGSGLDFVCSKCGKNAVIQRNCPECHHKLEIKAALDSAHYFPFTLSLIDLLDKRKDIFLENETNGQGEKIVIGQYLALLPKSEYKEIIENGKMTQNDEFEELLRKKAEQFRNVGIDEVTISTLIEAERKVNAGVKAFAAIGQVEQGLSYTSNDELKPIAEEILEYDELVHAKVILSLEDAECDAEIVNDGIKPDYVGIAKALGFSNVQICSSVPIVFAAYGYTRKEREPSNEGVKLHGFPQEMEKKNIYATRLETEGVLFELDRRKVLNWLLDNGLIQNDDLPQDMSDYGIKMWFLDIIVRH